jgi:hypothetical protein
VQVDMNNSGASVLEVAAPLDRVWAALPTVFAEIGLAGQVMDAEAHILGQPATIVRRRMLDTNVGRFLDCGARMGISNADAYTVEYAIRTQVQANGDAASRVLTLITGRARPTGTSDPWVNCGSTSELERRIQRALAQRLAAAS